MRRARRSVCRPRYSVPAVCRRSDLRPPTLHPWRLSLLLLAVLLDLCALRRAGWPTFQTPQGMYLQKVLKLLWRRRLPTLRAHDVPPVSKVPDWNTDLLTRGVPARRSASITYGGRASCIGPLQYACAAAALSCSAMSAGARGAGLPQPASVWRSVPWYLAATYLRPLYKSGPLPVRDRRRSLRRRSRPLQMITLRSNMRLLGEPKCLISCQVSDQLFRRMVAA